MPVDPAALGMADRARLEEYRGEAELVDCVTHHGSEWFTGPYGFVLDNAKPLPFTPCRGALGFFRVTTAR